MPKIEATLTDEQWTLLSDLLREPLVLGDPRAAEIRELREKLEESTQSA